MGILSPLEADTRLLIDRSLENLGWNLTGEDKNVFLEQPRTEEERQVLEHKRPDYILYSRNHEPLIVIEAKKKGERIDTALEQGIFYAERLKAPLVYATDGVFCKAFHVKAHRTPLLNGNELDEFIRQALAIKYLDGAEVNTISPKVQYDRKELIKIFDNANNMLRGDGLRAGIERFGEFANILFIKLLSEKGNIDDSCSWETIKQMPTSTRINYINNTVYNTLNNIYNTEIFIPLTMRDNEILGEIMKSLDPLTLTDVDSDVKGDAFEYFLKASTASGNDLGEYFTPRHIVKTMVRLTNPQIGEKVYDPFCGTGGFLIESFRHIYNNMPRNELTEKMLREDTIFGNEITNTARITKMNMILAGDGHSGIHKIDSLANPVKGKYDVVLANMPYSQKTKWGSLYDVSSKNGDSICVQHCMKAISSASENGRMALVVPEGFLFRKDLKKTREYLLQNSELQSIISLPQGVFLPYTGVKTDIIYATKVNQKIPSSKKRKNYWYFEVKNDGYSLDNYRRKLDTPSDLQKYEEYRKLDEDQKEEMQKIGFNIIPLDKVKEKDFNLIGNRYNSSNHISSIYPMIKLEDLFLEIKNGKNVLQINEKGKYRVSRIETISNGVVDLTKTKWTNDDINTNDFLQIGDILLSHINSYEHLAKTALFDSTEEVVHGCNLIRLRPNKQVINPKYASYIFKSYNFIQLAKKFAQRAVNQASIRVSDLKTIEIPLPPLEIQEKIVTELEGYQNIIDGAKKTLDNYFPIININSNWKHKKLNKVCYILNGSTPSRDNIKYWDKKDIPWLTLDDLKEQGREIFSTKQYISKQALDETSVKLLPPNTILLCCTASVGEYALTKIECTTNQQFNGLLINNENEKLLLPKFLFYYIAQLKHYLLSISTNTTFPYISVKTLGDLNIPIPPVEEQKQIVAQIEAEETLINSNKQIIEIFTQKIQDRINDLFEENHSATNTMTSS